MYLRYLVFVLFIALSGCLPAVQNVPSDYTFDKSKGTGLLVLTLSRTGDKAWPLGSLSFADEAETKAYNIPLGNIHGRKDFSTGDVRLDSFDGQLVTFELPAGKYSFQFYRNASGYVGRIPVNKSFRIEAGKANYIGNFKIDVKQRGRSATFDFYFYGESSRDKSLFHAKYPHLKDTDFRLDLWNLN